MNAPRNLVAALSVIVATVVVVALPPELYWPGIAVVLIGGLGFAAAYWYEIAIRLETVVIDRDCDNLGLAQDLEHTNARLAEVLDENQILSDELDLPVPYVLTAEAHAVLLPRGLRSVPTIPAQREGGDAS